MMSKKTYVDFARMIRAQRHKIAQAYENNRQPYPDITENEMFLAGASKQIDIILDELCILFQNDNPQFKPDQFLAACEIDTESK